MDEAEPLSEEPISEQPTAEPKGVSLREAQRRLGVGSVQTIQRWLEQGKLAGRKTARANGQERWEVDLPSDEADIERLRAQLRRPTNPSDVIFPGPPDNRDGEIERLERMNQFLMDELVSRRVVDQQKDRQIFELLQTVAILARPPQSALPSPGTGLPWWHTWLSLFRRRP